AVRVSCDLCHCQFVMPEGIIRMFVDKRLQVGDPGLHVLAKRRLGEGMLTASDIVVRDELQIALPSLSGIAKIAEVGGCVCEEALYVRALRRQLRRPGQQLERLL